MYVSGLGNSPTEALKLFQVCSYPRYTCFSHIDYLTSLLDPRKVSNILSFHNVHIAGVQYSSSMPAKTATNVVTPKIGISPGIYCNVCCHFVSKLSTVA